MKITATRRVTTVLLELTVAEAQELVHYLDADRNSPTRSTMYQALHVQLSALKRAEPDVLVDTLGPLEVPVPGTPTLAERLAGALEELENLEGDSDDFPAVQDKVLEARRPLSSALRAAQQYDSGQRE